MPSVRQQGGNAIAVKLKPITEQEFVAQVIAYLTLHGCFVWRQNQGGLKVGSRFVRFTSVVGVADVVGVMRGGKFIAIEGAGHGGH